MFIRFRQRGGRLHFTIAESRREGGRVRQRHVATIGRLRPPYLVARMSSWVEPFGRASIWDGLFWAADEFNLDLATVARLAVAIETRAPFPSANEVGLAAGSDLNSRWPEICRRHAALGAGADAVCPENVRRI
jgi:hypothetical protein